MIYSQLVMDHFQQPRQVGVLDTGKPNVVTAHVGSHEQGALVQVYLEFSSDAQIAQASFKAYGCPCTIAAASLLLSQLQGMNSEQAEQLSRGRWADELDLPPIKLHSAMLAKEAVLAALEKWQSRQSVTGMAALPSGV